MPGGAAEPMRAAGRGVPSSGRGRWAPPLVALLGAGAVVLQPVVAQEAASMPARAAVAAVSAPMPAPAASAASAASAVPSATAAGTPARAPGSAAAVPSLPPLAGPGAQLGPGWRVAGLPGQKAPLTRYGVAQFDGFAALRIEAAASYGNLVLDLPGPPAPARLRWRWRVDEPNAAVDLARKAGDDASAKVCLAFELPLERVPFVERQLLRLARSRTGEPLPAATLCWVWGGAEARGAALDNPYSRRVRVIVLRNREDASGRWFDEDRDVAADWRRTFGDESAEMPPLAAVIVAADADNTGAASVAHVAGLRFVP